MDDKEATFLIDETTILASKIFKVINNHIKSNQILNTEEKLRTDVEYAAILFILASKLRCFNDKQLEIACDRISQDIKYTIKNVIIKNV